MTDPNQPPVPPQPSVPPQSSTPPAAPPPPAPAYQAAPPVTPPPVSAPPTAAPGYAAAPPATFPGKSLGIAGLIVAIAGFFIFPLVAPIAGLIMSIIARKQSREAGFANGPAKAGVIVSIIAIVLEVIGLIIFIVVLVALAGSVIDACAQLGPGVWEVDGITYTCN
ncbi:hypothetical protein N1031_15620 [Herbiconiux moechotypicola]|uniref:DUF4190 domain-containing protein n=1 Tax=Herbiconiux moechotypicola TaxID=637393 RepID=A0ABN3E050_9MICO|nr:hypothetical protein [Herbiconiux moechotypicola]MCS5731194.1 hypothetical protein [Herbiconiux moechotypicola]